MLEPLSTLREWILHSLSLQKPSRLDVEVLGDGSGMDAGLFLDTILLAKLSPKSVCRLSFEVHVVILQML